ncbi:MAG: hypothetical protein EPO64_04910 [Nitrospirae bacterium]|nr:MAG: hypothetical protein EPO64_04910 [Nitrospirota bacterium]
MANAISWIVTSVLIAIPIGYFAIRWDNEQFRDGALGNWFGTVAGVVGGVPIALWLSARQQRAQEAAKRSSRARDRAEQIRHLRGRQFEELQHNTGAVSQLQDILSKTRTARADVWEWAARVVDSFEFDARRHFELLALTPAERLDDADLERAYRDLQRLTYRVREAAAAHAFFYGYSADEKSANWQQEEVRHFAELVSSDLTKTVQRMKESGAA